MGKGPGRWFVLFPLFFLLAVSGCRVASVPSPAVPEPTLSGQELRVVTTYGPNDGGHLAFQALCDDFSTETGVTVMNDSSDSTEEWKQSVIASFESGRSPDILFFFTGPDVEKLISGNQFVSLDEIRESYPDYGANIDLSVLENMKAADGKGYAIPVKGYWERLFVNTDLFAELNLPLPETYEDLFTLAPRFREAGIIPIAASLQEVPHYLFEYLLFNFTGPSKHHAIPADPNALPQSWIAALEQFPALYEAGMFPEDEDAPTHADAFELFQSKKAAMILDGDWSVAYVRDVENVAVVNFPAMAMGPRKNTDLISGFSMGFYISRKAWDDPDKRDAAVALVQFITSNASIARLNVSGAAMPVIPSSADPSTGTTPDAQSDRTPLRRSINELNQHTTAFVGAAADEVRIEVRAWLFGQILPLARGEIQAQDVLEEFIALYCS